LTNKQSKTEYVKHYPSLMTDTR